MSDQRPEARFLSLKWKSAIALGLLLVLLFALLAWHFQQELRTALNTRLLDLRSVQLNALEEAVYRNGDRLRSALASVASIDDTPTDNTLPLFSALLESFASNWQLDQLLLIDADGEIIAHQSRGLAANSSAQDQRQNLRAWLQDDISVPQLPAVTLLCHEQCRQVISLPLGANRGYLVAVRPMRAIAEHMERATGARLALVVAREGDADLSLPAWDTILLHGSDEAFAVVRAASEHFSLDDFAGLSRSLSWQGRHYALSLVPARGLSNVDARYLLIEDVTSAYAAVSSQMYRHVIVVFCLVLVFSAYLLTLMWRRFNHIKSQLQVLPLFGQLEFHKIRKLISHHQRPTLLRDERHDLDDAINSLTYQLESLETTVSARTREMERLSLFDSLTGLANRNLMQYELRSDVERFRTEGGMLAVVILDLDRFKRINDTLGHQVGDMLLVKIGMRLKNATRSLGLVARLGGDEFAIILRSAKKYGQVEALCQKILELVHRPMTLDEHPVVISCSLGIALASTSRASNQESDHDLLKQAEMAMYKAKENGGNIYRIYNPLMAAEAHANLSLEAELRRAFEQNEFTLYLQPKVAMDGVIAGFESLIRWDHPDRGIIMPNEFIPALENLGLISRLDNLVLEASCRQLKIMQVHYPEISIAVNISSTHFTDKNFLTFLKTCLEKYPIDPSRLELEITETLLMKNMSVGMDIIQQIKALGVSIAIDDFGTGYSSLSYLKKLPVDTIKIDREFIKDIPDSESDMQISSVIIFLAKQLNFKVVAEGVETAEQLAFLKANQCDLAQGYLFSKPMPAHKAILMLESRREHQQVNAR